MKIKKNTKRFTQKKVSNYDFKWIIIIASALIAVVMGILIVLAISSYKNSYVSYVDGKGIRDYEYKMFLNTKVSEMEEEAQGDDEEFSSDDFWTDEKKTEAEQAALEDVRAWQAKYLLALDNGCKLTKAEEEAVESEINYYIYYYQQMYSQYGIDTSSILSMLGIEDLDQTYAFQKKQKVISKYAEKLMDAMTEDELYFTDENDVKTTGNEAIVAKYNSDIATYRKVELTSYLVLKATSGVEQPTVVEDPGDAPADKEETSEEYLAWQSEKEAYEQYLADVENYSVALQEAVFENAEMREKVSAIYEALKANGKYTGEGVKEYQESEDAEAAPKSYTDATLKDLAKSEGALYSETEGVNKFSGDPTETTDLLTKYATSLDWTDDTRTAVTYTEAKAETNEEDASAPKTYTLEDNAEAAEDTENAEDTETEDEDLEYPNDYTTSALNELKFFEDDTYFYITMCTNIYDINTDTSMEEDTENSDNNSVRFNVVDDLKEAKVEDDLDALVEKDAKRFQNKKIRNKVIKTVSESVFSSAS